MRSEEEVFEAYALAKELTDRMDDNEYHLESIAPAILKKGLGWALEEEGELEDLLDDLREDIELTETGEFEL